MRINVWSYLKSIAVLVIFLPHINALASIPVTEEWQDTIIRTGEFITKSMATDSAGNVYTSAVSREATTISRIIYKHTSSGVEVPGPSGSGPWNRADNSRADVDEFPYTKLIIDETHGNIFLLVLYKRPTSPYYAAVVYKHDLATGAKIWSSSAGSTFNYADRPLNTLARMTVDHLGNPWVARDHEVGIFGFGRHGFEVYNIDGVTGAKLIQRSIFQSGKNKYLQSIGAANDNLFITYSEVSLTASTDLVATVYDISSSSLVFRAKGEYSWPISEPDDDSPHYVVPNSAARHHPIFTAGVVTADGNFAIGGYYTFPREKCTDGTGECFGTDHRYYPVVITVEPTSALIESTYIEQGTDKGAWTYDNSHVVPPSGFSFADIKRGRGTNVLLMIGNDVDDRLFGNVQSRIWESDVSGKKVATDKLINSYSERIEIPAGSGCIYAPRLVPSVFAYVSPQVNKGRLITAGKLTMVYDSNQSSSCTSDTLSRKRFRLTSFGSNYCSSRGNDTYYEWIKGITVRGDYRTSGNNSGYVNYTNGANISLQKGFNALTVTPWTRSSDDEFWNLWIDINHDFTFTPNEIVYSGSGNGRTALYGDITIPNTAFAGETMMRVSMQYKRAPPVCGNFRWGEVEDYTVNILQ